MPLFIIVLFRISREWKPFKYQYIDKWINKRQYKHVIEYILIFTRKIILSQITTWMKLEDITLSEKGQSHKDNVI